MSQRDDYALEGHPRRPPVTAVDWLMLLLALVSVVLLAWITFWDVPAETERRVILADYVVCGIFAVEFLVRWRRSGMGLRFPLLYWYEVLGMIPISHPAFRSFRLLRIVVVVARLARAADRAFGDRVFGALVGRFAETIVDVIRRPMTVAIMDEVIAVLQTGNYTANIARALDENRAELDAMVLEMIRKDERIGKLRYVPFHGEIVNLVTDTVFRLVFEVLADPRTDELIQDVIRENADQMRQAVRERGRRVDRRDPVEVSHAPPHVAPHRTGVPS